MGKTHCKNLYCTLHQEKIIPQCQWNKYEDWQQQNYTQKLTQKQWEELFSARIRNRKKLLAFNINFYTLHNPP